MDIIIPHTIECEVTDGSQPIEGLMVWSQFRTSAKNPYTIIFGPTDGLGRTSITCEEIKQWAASEIELAVMDFHPLESSFAGIIEFRVMNEQDLGNALQAYELYKSVSYYPEEYYHDLRNAREVFRSLRKDISPSLSVRIDPDSIKKLADEFESRSRTRRIRALGVAVAMDAVRDVEEYLLQMLRDEDHFLRSEAARAMRSCDTPAARHALRELLLDRSPSVQEAAENTLQSFAEGIAPPPLPSLDTISIAWPPTQDTRQ